MFRLALAVVIVFPALWLSAQEVGKLKPRAPLTADEYSQQVARLREDYGKPPAQWPRPQVDEGVQFVQLGIVPAVPYPKDNPHSEAKANLGKLLFFDPRLSGSKQIACASCHDPDLSWADGRTTSFGHGRKQLKRNSPSLLNIGHMPALFWDGRAKSLEDQAVQVLVNPDEMQAEPDALVKVLNGSKAYRGLFTDAFGDDKVTFERVAQALATFQRGIKGGGSKFDRFVKEGPKLLSDSEVRGLHLFRTDARCVNCHNGPLLSDGQFHDVGLSYYGRQFEDLGRYNITKNAKDVGKFRTPSLRNVGRTGPYMHNGLFELAGVLNAYNAGMPTLRPKGEQVDPLFPTKSALLKPLGLNKQDLQDLEAFLLTLNEPVRRVRAPELPKVDEPRRELP